MRKNKNVVSANFWRGSGTTSCIEVFLDETPHSIDIWAGIIEHCAKRLGEKEIEEVISILSRTKDVLQKLHNFPPIYEEMLSDLIKVRIKRYGVKKDDERASPWRCRDIPGVEKMFERNFNIKDVHIYSCDIGCNLDNGEWTTLTLSLKFRDENKEVNGNGR